MRRHKNEENAHLPEHDFKILNFVAEESESLYRFYNF